MSNARRVLGCTLIALAAATAACDDRGTQPPIVTGNAMADSADQIMFGARALLTDQGVMRGELTADTAYWFDDNTRMEMRIVRTDFFTQTGAKNGVLTSREGTYNTRTGIMQARGDVKVVSQPDRTLTSAVITYDQARNEIASDSAFVVTEPGRNLEGIGFRSDPNMANVRCLSACRGSAGTVALPTGPDPSASSAGSDSIRRPPAGRPGTFTLPGTE